MLLKWSQKNADGTESHDSRGLPDRCGLTNYRAEAVEIAERMAANHVEGKVEVFSDETPDAKCLHTVTVRRSVEYTIDES